MSTVEWQARPGRARPARADACAPSWPRFPRPGPVDIGDVRGGVAGDDPGRAARAAADVHRPDSDQPRDARHQVVRPRPDRHRVAVALSVSAAAARPPAPTTAAACSSRIRSNGTTWWYPQRRHRHVFVADGSTRRPSAVENPAPYAISTSTIESSSFPHRWPPFTVRGTDQPHSFSVAPDAVVLNRARASAERVRVERVLTHELVHATLHENVVYDSIIPAEPAGDGPSGDADKPAPACDTCSGLVPCLVHITNVRRAHRAHAPRSEPRRRRPRPARQGRPHRARRLGPAATHRR